MVDPTEEEAGTEPILPPKAATDEPPSPSSPLMLPQVEKGLHTLGRSPHNLRYAYLGLDASGLGVTGIEVLRDYSHLESVDVHDNRIADLSPLACLPYLTRLDASHNAVTESLSFKTPKCNRSSSSWNEGDQWVGSALAEVNLSFNLIRTIGGDNGLLYWHKYLRVLDLSHNGIEKIEGLEGLSRLEVLRLGHNRIARVEGLASTLPLTELGLEHNEIDSVSGLEGLSQLQVLDISYNRVSSLEPLQTQRLLKRLDAGHNAIEDVKGASAWLAHLPHLHALTLAGNPVCDKEYYRERILVRTQQVVVLDDVAVTHREKVHALNLHGRDLANRQATFAQHFPGQPFRNLLPPFVEEDAGHGGQRTAAKGSSSTSNKPATAVGVSED